MRTFFQTAMLIVLLVAFSPAHATSESIDNSDLWWNAGESGWGMQLVQRKDIIFATLFVYGQTNSPVWYVATLSSAGGGAWTGDLLATTGPWFGTVPFNPASVTSAKVGTLTFTANSDQDGTLVYSVSSTTVTKAITRQSLRVDDYSGSYIGLIYQTALGCTNPADRISTSNRIDFDITQTGVALGIISQQQGTFPVCQSTGTLSTYGQFAGTTQVIANCNDGTAAGNVMAISNINITPSGIMMNYTAPSTNTGSKGCNYSGSIFGIRH
jgi:hypothetical protein